MRAAGEWPTCQGEHGACRVLTIRRRVRAPPAPPWCRHAVMPDQIGHHANRPSPGLPGWGEAAIDRHVVATSPRPRGSPFLLYLSVTVMKFETCGGTHGAVAASGAR